MIFHFLRRHFHYFIDFLMMPRHYFISSSSSAAIIDADCFARPPLFSPLLLMPPLFQRTPDAAALISVATPMPRRTPDERCAATRRRHQNADAAPPSTDAAMDDRASVAAR